jgi:predicted anti-sigma-YlaC factor YlaD
MNAIKCEDAILTMMALLDGEEAKVSSEQAAIHLDECENCRREIEQMRNTVNLFKGRQRREQSADLWFEIEKRLEAQTSTAPPVKWQPFLILVAGLVAYKLFEMIPERELVLSLKLVPLILVVAMFVFLKENPFKINTELALER